jgi:hypothetical protein
VLEATLQVSQVPGLEKSDQKIIADLKQVLKKKQEQNVQNEKIKQQVKEQF